MLRWSSLIAVIACFFCAQGITVEIGCGVLNAQEKYAFVVGVENYDPQFFRNLEYAEEDASELASQLESMGYNTILMSAQQRNPQHKPNTAEKILRLLDGQLKAIQKDDVLVVSFSGHGVQFKGEDELEGGGKETYFVPEEGTLADKSTLLPMFKEIVSRIDECKAQRKLVLIDACRNEVLSAVGDKSAGKIDLGSVHENMRIVPKGMTVVFSCSNGQKSWETDEFEHSVFSSFVLDYLAGKSGEDFYTDQKADVGGLIDYARRKTHQYVLKNINPTGQYPQVIGVVEQWPLGKVGPPGVFTSQFGHKMRLIPAGTFLMGTPEGEYAQFSGDETQHEVDITKPFFMSAHEITVAQFREFVAETSREMPKQEYGYDQEQESFVFGKFNWENPGWEQSEEHPVVSVNWQDAIDYCEWLSQQEGKTYRLPSEAEWEYACRAGTTTTYSFPNNKAKEYANFSEEVSTESETDNRNRKFTVPVGSLKANDFGLFDMHGNAQEWCMDFYGADYFENSPKRDPQGPLSEPRQRRVLKGGSFRHLLHSVRSPSRSRFGTEDRIYHVGFRIVCEIEE